MNIILNSNIFEDMSRAIGALAVGGVGAAMVASNSLYTGQFDQNHSKVLVTRFVTHLFSGGWSQSSQIQPIDWCWRHNLF